MINIIKIINGDLLQATEKLICHSCNCQGVMGAGIALQVRLQFPQVYSEYKRLCNHTDPEQLLGTIQCVEVNLNRVFVNLFGQLGYGGCTQNTDYDALRKGLVNVRDIAKQYNISVAIPYNVGCALGGGDWNVVYKMIEEIFGDYDVTLYRWDG